MSATLVALLVVTGCAPGATSPTGGTGTQPPGTPGVTAPTEGAGTQAPGTPGEGGPSQLTFTIETDAVGTGTVTLTDGGTVAATASDGTTFELVVPPLAVAQDTQILVTPLSDVRGIGDGPVHAVQLEPEGQVFYDFVRLTITPATPIPLEEQLMFEAAGDGSHPTLALIDPAAEPIVLLLDHFSVAGVAAGASDDRAAVPEPAASEAEARLVREFNERVQEERAHRDERDNDADRARLADDLKALLDEYEREVLDPRRRAAHESCAAANALFATLARLEKWRHYIVGADAERAAAVMDEARSVLLGSIERCEAEAISKCRAAKPPSPTILVDYWISVARAADLLPAPEALAKIPDSAEWLDRAQEICLAQDYRIDKTLEVTQMNLTVSIRYTATKCGGHEGTWTIDSAGTLSGYGGSADITSPITVEIPAGSTEGAFTGVARYEDDIGGQTEGIFSGTATFIEEPATLELEITDGRYGIGNGYRWGFHDDGFMGPGSLTFPLEAGDFCE